MITTKNDKRSRRRHRTMNGPALREQAAVLGHDMRQLAATAGETILDQVDPLEEYVRQKPLRSLMIAAGVGALFGLLFRRR